MTCKICNGFGYLLTAPSTCSAGGERVICPVCTSDAAASEAAEVKRLRATITEALRWLYVEYGSGTGYVTRIWEARKALEKAIPTTSTQGGAEE